MSSFVNVTERYLPGETFLLFSKCVKIEFNIHSSFLKKRCQSGKLGYLSPAPEESPSQSPSRSCLIIYSTWCTVFWQLQLKMISPKSFHLLFICFNFPFSKNLIAQAQSNTFSSPSAHHILTLGLDPPGLVLKQWVLLWHLFAAHKAFVPLSLYNAWLTLCNRCCLSTYLMFGLGTTSTPLGLGNKKSWLLGLGKKKNINSGF